MPTPPTGDIACAAVTDAEEPRSIPDPKAIDTHREQLDVIPGLQFIDPVAQERSDLDDFLAKGCEAPSSNRVVSALANDESTLPVIATVDHDQDPASVEPAGGLIRIRGMAGQPHPEYVDRCADVLHLEASPVADDGVSPVCTDSQLGSDLKGAIPCRRSHPDDLAVLFQEPGHLGVHQEVERGIALRSLGDEIEEVPLRHERDELAMSREVSEVGDGHFDVPDVAAQLSSFLVRPFEEFVKEPKLVQDFQRGGMNRITAEIPQEVSMFFEDRDIDPGPRE